MFTLSEVECLGACVNAPMVQVSTKRAFETAILCNKTICYLFNIVVYSLCFHFGLKVPFVLCANEQIGNDYIKSVLRFTSACTSVAQVLVSIVCEVKLKKLFNEEQNENNSQHTNPWQAIGANFYLTPSLRKTNHLNSEDCRNQIYDITVLKF